MYFNDFFDERPYYPRAYPSQGGFWEEPNNNDIFNFFHPSSIQRSSRPSREQQARMMRERQLKEEQRKKMQQEFHKKKQLEMQEKKRKEELERKEKAATYIQRIWRGYKVRKLEIISKLRLLNQINNKIEEIVNRYKPKIQETINPSNADIKRRYRNILGLEEDLTKQLFSLDSIITSGVEILRKSRKKIVQRIQKFLHELDVVKKEVKVKFDQVEKEEEEERQRKQEERRLEEERKAKMEIEEVEPTVEMEERKGSYEIPIRFVEGEDRKMETEGENEKEPMETSSQFQEEEEEVEDVSYLKNEIDRLKKLLSEKDHYIQSLEDELEQLKSKL